MNLGFLRAEPSRRRVFRTNHQIDTTPRVDTVSDRAQETVSIWREVDASGVENGADGRRILMGEPAVFLTGPGGGLEVVERSIQGPEVGLLSNLDELGVPAIIVCVMPMKAS